MSKSNRSLGTGWVRPLRPIGWWPALALVAAGACAYAWARPLDHEVTAPRPYSTTYHFDYHAEAAGSPVVYEGNHIRFGDPLFRSLVDAIDINVDFTVDSPGAMVSDATMTTKVVVASSAGWTRTLDPTDPVPFDGAGTSATIHLDLAKVDRVAAATDAAAGVTGAVSVTVLATVDAKVHLPGNVAGGSERTSVTVGSLVFDVDPTVVRLQGYTAPTAAEQILGGTDPAVAAASEDTGGPGGVPSQDTAKTLATQSIVGMVDTTYTEPMVVGLGKWDVKVRDMRAGTLIALGVFLLLAVYNMLALFLAGRRGEAEYLEARFGAQIFPLTDVPDSIREHAVWVGSFEALAAAASNAEADILHQVTLDSDWYYVFDGPTVFAYRALTNGVRVEPGEPAS